MLLFSPWLFELSSGAQWQTASIVGILIGVMSIAALAAFAVWEEWFILVAALALIVSPWLLGFQNSDDAMTVDVVIGVSVAGLAAFERLGHARNSAAGRCKPLSRRPHHHKQQGGLAPPCRGICPKEPAPAPRPPRRGHAI